MTDTDRLLEAIILQQRATQARAAHWIAIVLQVALWVAVLLPTFYAGNTFQFLTFFVIWLILTMLVVSFRDKQGKRASDLEAEVDRIAGLRLWK